MSRLCFLAISIAVLLSGCGTSGKNEAFVQPISATDSSDFAVPQSVSPDYAAKVMTKLEEVRGDVRRDVVMSKKFSTEDQRKLNATFAEPSLSFQSKLWREAAAERGESKFVKNPGPATWTVVRIAQSRSDCIWFKATSDDSKNLVHPQGGSPIVIDVVLRRWAHDEKINPTPWVISQYTPESLGAVDPGLGCDDTSDRIPPNKLSEAYRNYA